MNKENSYFKDLKTRYLFKIYLNLSLSTTFLCQCNLVQLKIKNQKMNGLKINFLQFKDTLKIKKQILLEYTN